MTRFPAANVGPSRLEHEELAPAAALAPYLGALRSHRRLVVAIMLTAVLASTGWIFVQGTSYEATASVVVVPVPEGDAAFSGLPLIRSGGSDSARAVETAVQLLDTPEAAELTAKRLGDGLTASAVRAAVEVEAEPESDIVEITASAPNGERAADLANEFAAAALDARARELKPLIAAAAAASSDAIAAITDRSGTVADELRARSSALAAISDDPALTFARQATVPPAPVGSPPWLVLALALTAGLVVGAVTAVLIEVLAPRALRDETDLARIYPRPILARVPELPGRLVRATRRQRRLGAIGEGFRSLRSQLELRARDRAPSAVRGSGAVLLTSPARDDGATAAALELAEAMAKGGQSVIAIDFTLRRAPAAGLEPSTSGGGMTALLGGAENLGDALQPLEGVPGVRVLTAWHGLSLEQVEMLTGRMPEIVAEARRHADWVIVDAPPLGELSDALGVLDAVDDVVVVVRTGRTSLMRLTRLRDALESVDGSALGYLVVGGASMAVDGYGYGYGYG